MYSICTINRFTCQKKWAGADPKYRLRLQIKFKIGCCSGSSYKSYKKNSAPTRSGSETLFSIINDFLCVLLADWWIVRSSPRIPNVSTTGLGKKNCLSLYETMNHAISKKLQCFESRFARIRIKNASWIRIRIQEVKKPRKFIRWIQNWTNKSKDPFVIPKFIFFYSFWFFNVIFKDSVKNLLV